MSPESLSETPTDADGTERDATGRATRGPGSPAGTTPATVGTELDTDTLFELLQNQRRRDALRYLGANEGRTTLSDMAEHIAAKENDLPVGAINSKQRKRVYIGLYQCHLPKLDTAGVVEYDKNRGTVVLRKVAGEVLEYLEEDPVAADDDDSTDGGRVRETAVSSTIAAGLGAAGLQVTGVVAGLSISSVLALVVGAALVSLVTATRRTVLGRER
jgi:hypothetical protein